MEQSSLYSATLFKLPEKDFVYSSFTFFVMYMLYLFLKNGFTSLPNPSDVIKIDATYIFLCLYSHAI